MKKYYAVKSSTISFIAETWEEASQKMVGLKKVSHKSFTNYDDAKAFLEGKDNEPKINALAAAYIDGSYDDSTGSYSFGGVLIYNNCEKKFNKKYEDDEYKSMRNVAGEIKGAGYIIQHCINSGIKELDLYFDYIGIEKWYTGEWKASCPIARVYQEFAQKAKEKIKINFHKVKSHTNDYYNDMADKLAKDALGI